MHAKFKYRHFITRKMFFFLGGGVNGLLDFVIVIECEGHSCIVLVSLCICIIIYITVLG